VIVFSAGGKLFQVPASGGTARPVVLADTSRHGILRWPAFLPDGKRILVTAGYVPSLETVIVEMESGGVTPVPGAGTNARYIEPASLLSFQSDGSGMVMPFDWRRGRATGSATPVLEGLYMGLQGVAKLANSPNGWAVYVPTATSRRQLALVDRRGAETILAADARPFSDPRFSPDGRQVAVTSLSPGGGLAGDIWIFNLGQATLSRLTFEGRHQFPEWSPDGRRVIFAGLAGSGAMRWIPSAGGEMDSLFQRPGALIFEGILTRDQRNIVYRLGGIPGDLYHARRDSLSEPQVLVATPFDERAPALSPDDRWLAYVSNETGRDEIYVRPFPGGGGRWMVSAAGGTEPRWRRDGRELFYRNADTLFAIQVSAQPDFAVGQRTALFTGEYLTNLRHATYDVHPNGNQFIFITGVPDDAGELILVQNLLSTVFNRGGGKRSR
jgi:Tol biopolymer transport system component